MGKFDGYLIMSDFDNTLAYSRILPDGRIDRSRTISPENCEAIRYFQSEGGLFTLATGRQFNWLEQWREYFVPNTYVSALNGAYLCDPSGRELLFQSHMDADFIELANRIREACPDLVQIYFHPLFDGFAVPAEQPITAALFPKPVYKMVFYVKPETGERNARLIASMIDPARYITMRSWNVGIEVQMKGSGKGDSVRRLKEHLGDAARVVVAVGDYENDIDMVKAADIGYAVSNAVPALKAVADRITVPCSESALAAVIADLERSL